MEGYYGKQSCKYIKEYIYLWEDAVQGYDLWLYDDADHPMFTDEKIKEAKSLLEKALSVENDIIYIKRIEKLMLGIEYLELVRSNIDSPNRNQLIDKFHEKLKQHRITEIHERTNLNLSIEYMKNSQYCKERKDWYSVYYIRR